MLASYYLTAIVNNCTPRRQLGSCSVTRPLLSLRRVWPARLEAAQKNVQTLRGSEVPQLHKFNRRRPTEKKSPKEGKKPCYRCGRAGHAPKAAGLDKPSASNAVKVGTMLVSAEEKADRRTQQQKITPWEDPMGRHRVHRAPAKH